MAKEKATTVVLVNPEARAGKLDKFWKKNKRRVLSLLKSSFRVIETTRGDHGSGIVRNALKEGTKRVIVVGGDGTLSKAVEGFFDHFKPINPDACLVVLPGGRGDDFFKTVSRRKFVTYRRAWKYALKILSCGELILADVGQFVWQDNDPNSPGHFINIVSFGFPGRIIERVRNRMEVFGIPRSKQGNSTYVLHGIAAFFEYKPKTIRMKVDGKNFFEGQIYAGFILNGKYNGGGLLWDSAAQLDDGLFHMVIIERSWLGLPWIFRTTGKKVEIELLWDKDARDFPFFESDGELLPHENGRRIVFQLLPGALKLQVASNRLTAAHP